MALREHHQRRRQAVHGARARPAYAAAPLHCVSSSPHRCRCHRHRVRTGADPPPLPTCLHPHAPTPTVAAPIVRTRPHLDRGNAALHAVLGDEATVVRELFLHMLHATPFVSHRAHRSSNTRPPTFSALGTEDVRQPTTPTDADRSGSTANYKFIKGGPEYVPTARSHVGPSTVCSEYGP